MSSPPPPVYIVSSERSGSNLLRKRLSEIQEVYAGPSPAHFLKHLFYREYTYGDLTDDSYFLKLIEDAVALTKVHFSGWETNHEPKVVLDRYRTSYPRRGIVQLADLLMRMNAEQTGYHSYVCKDNNVFDFAYPILRNLPDAKFIYLHRDPRDYTVSQLQRKLATNSVYSISKRWREEQNVCISLHSYLGKDRVFRVSYEELIGEEERTLGALCDFLAVERLAQRKSKTVMADNVQEWQNLNKETMRDNAGKWKRLLKPKQIMFVESVCWHPMRHLGYTPESVRPLRISNKQRAWDMAWGTATGYLAKTKALRAEGMEGRRERNELLRRLQG